MSADTAAALAKVRELEQAEQKVAPAPWDAENEENRREQDAFLKLTDANGKRICDTFNADGQEIHYEADEDGAYYFEGGQRRTDLEFIAALRNAAPTLLELVTALLDSSASETGCWCAASYGDAQKHDAECLASQAALRRFVEGE